MKQKYNQTVVDYVEDVQLANMRLNVPLPEEQIVDLVCNSLLPKYAIVIAYFDDKNIESLVNVCKRFERSLPLTDSMDSKANYFKKKPPFYNSQPAASSTSHTSTSHTPSSSPLTSSHSPPFNKNKVRCTFCNTPGHTWNFCRKRKFQYQQNQNNRQNQQRTSKN